MVLLLLYLLLELLNGGEEVLHLLCVRVHGQRERCEREREGTVREIKYSKESVCLGFGVETTVESPVLDSLSRFRGSFDRKRDLVFIRLFEE